ncbi:MAG: hypothetical protein RLZZ210_1498 [Pseudomonadota bacterium]|jgi:hypothetical protein
MSKLSPKNLFSSVKSSKFNFFNSNFEIKAGRNTKNLTELFNTTQNQNQSVTVSKWKLNKVFSKLQSIKFNPQTTYALAQTNNDSQIVKTTNQTSITSIKNRTINFFAPKSTYTNGAERPQSIPLQGYNLTNIQKDSDKNLNSLLEYQTSGNDIGKFALSFNTQNYHASHIKMAFDVFANLEIDLSKLPQIQEHNAQIVGSYQEWLNFNTLFIKHQPEIQKFAVENHKEANIFDELSEKETQLQADKIQEFLQEYEPLNLSSISIVDNSQQSKPAQEFIDVVQNTLNSINNNPSLVKYLSYSLGKKWNLENTQQKFNEISYHLNSILKYLNSNAFKGMDSNRQKWALEKLCGEDAYAPLLVSCQKLLQLLDIKNIEKTIYNNPSERISQGLDNNSESYQKYKKIPIIGGLVAHNVKYPKSFFGLHASKDKNDKSLFISDNHQKFKDKVSPFLSQKFRQELNQSSNINLINKGQLSVFKANLRKDLNLLDGKFDKLLQPLRKNPFMTKMGIYTAILASFAAYIAAAVHTGGLATQVASLPVSMAFGTAFGDPLHHLIMFSISIMLGLALTFVVGKDNSLVVFKAIGRVAKKIAKNYKFIAQQIKDYGIQGALAKMQENFARGNFKVLENYKNSLNEHKHSHDDDHHHIKISKDKTIKSNYGLKKNVKDMFEEGETDFLDLLENMLDSLNTKEKQRTDKAESEEIKDKNTQIRQAVSKAVRYFSRRGLLGMAIDGGKKMYSMARGAKNKNAEVDINDKTSLAGAESTHSLKDLYPDASEKELRINAYKHVLLALQMQKNGKLADLMEMVKNQQDLSQEFDKLSIITNNANIEISSNKLTNNIKNKSLALDSSIQLLEKVKHHNPENIQNLINALGDFKDLLAHCHDDSMLNNLETLFTQTLSNVKSILNNMDNSKNKLHTHAVSSATKQWVENFPRHIVKETEGITYTNYRFNKEKSNVGIRGMLNYKLGNLFKIIGNAVPWKLLGGVAVLLLILKPIINTSPIELIPGLDKIFEIASKPYELIMGGNDLGINVNATTDVSIDFPAHIAEGVIGTMFVLSNSMTDLVKKTSKSLWNSSKSMMDKLRGKNNNFGIDEANLTSNVGGVNSGVRGYSNLTSK